MNRGEVWWAEDPELGRRPHLILTREAAVTVLSGLLAVPATRTIRGLPTEVSLTPADGMPEECVLALDNVTVVHRSLFRERICRLSDERMRETCDALRYATGCD